MEYLWGDNDGGQSEDVSCPLLFLLIEKINVCLDLSLFTGSILKYYKILQYWVCQLHKLSAFHCWLYYNEELNWNYGARLSWNEERCHKASERRSNELFWWVLMYPYLHLIVPISQQRRIHIDLAQSLLLQWKPIRFFLAKV